MLNVELSAGLQTANMLTSKVRKPAALRASWPSTPCYQLLLGTDDLVAQALVGCCVHPCGARCSDGSKATTTCRRMGKRSSPPRWRTVTTRTGAQETQRIHIRRLCLCRRGQGQSCSPPHPSHPRLGPSACFVVFWATVPRRRQSRPYFSSCKLCRLCRLRRPRRPGRQAPPAGPARRPPQRLRTPQARRLAPPAAHRPPQAPAGSKTLHFLVAKKLH